MKTLTRTFFATITSLLSWIPFNVHAAAIDDALNSVKSIQGKAGIRSFSSLPMLFSSVLAFALTFMAVIAVAVVIYAGFTYITSLGDEKKAAEAKHTILYAVIGLIIIGAAALIVNAIISLI
jgi:hypothetical protein